MKYILITIDVEGPKGEGFDASNPVESFIWCNNNSNEPYGLEKIMDMLESFGIKGLFFVDFAEAFDYGKEKIAAVIKRIEERGHSVGVHLHPNHILDENRHFLFQYSKEEQYQMISYCTGLFEEILNCKPLFFRAGKYSANYDTLDILNELGYRYDFSQYYKSKWCGIDPPLTADHPCRYKRMIEIPVTTFYSIFTPIYKRVDKIDLEMIPFGHNYVMKKLAKIDKSIAVLFLHSFSFVNWRENPESPGFNVRKYKTVHRNIERAIKMDDYRVIDPDEIVELFDSEKISCYANSGCRIAIKNPILSYFFILLTANRIKKTNKKAMIFMMMNICLFILVLIVISRIFLGRHS